MRTVWILFVSLFFLPAPSEAAPHGRYQLNHKKILEQLIPIMMKDKRIPPDRRQVFLQSFKDELNATSTWLELKKDKTFKVFIKKAGKTKPKLDAKGVWKQTRKVLTMLSHNLTRQRSELIRCKVQKTRLICRGKNQRGYNKIALYFDKK
ncbi:MAG: hypothetical protein EP343_24905 [Deltaproteobacteria bacterium]|nr:MAG: hypothetical protein EP343_24905 [Deltaproteobacteria bacterium]